MTTTPAQRWHLPPGTPATLSLPQAVRISGKSRDTLLRAIHQDEGDPARRWKPLKARKEPNKNRYVILAGDLNAWLEDAHPDA